jgi:hypothetical protein
MRSPINSSHSIYFTEGDFARRWRRPQPETRAASPAQHHVEPTIEAPKNKTARAMKLGRFCVSMKEGISE